MFTIFYIFFMFILLPHLDASSRNSNNESNTYYNYYARRVYYGKPAKLGDVPYQVAFKMRIPKRPLYVTFCGGVIISPKKLLSAAHCFVSESKNICKKIFGGGQVRNSISNVYAVAGNLKNRDYYSVDADGNGQWRQLKSFVYPDTYKFPRDDIAIVWTKKPFINNSHVNFIPIARKHIEYKGSCLVSGYGRTSPTTTSSVLLLANLNIIPTRKCNKMHRRNMKAFVCTSSVLADVGKGDSGGPLVCKKTGDPNEVGGKGILVGIVSGNRLNVGSFFTRVSSYYSYIKRNKCHVHVLDIRFLSILTIHLKLLLF